ncbi:hypothetical protein V6N12_009408 [Hibiscus sabdariffa]|uniref:Uncharacterized protein n=1 Tax=Hibiscus sabdariffa TaxID=183260 RepID=A0ABR2E925_9ROSI
MAAIFEQKLDIELQGRFNNIPAVVPIFSLYGRKVLMELYRGEDPRVTSIGRMDKAPLNQKMTRHTPISLSAQQINPRKGLSNAITYPSARIPDYVCMVSLRCFFKSLY